MDDDEGANQRHAGEVDKPRAFIAAHQPGDRLQLYRLPHAQARDDGENDDRENADIERLLDVVIPAPTSCGSFPRKALPRSPATALG